MATYALSAYLQRFFTEWPRLQMKASPNTIESYRDTFRLLRLADRAQRQDGRSVIHQQSERPPQPLRCQCGVAATSTPFGPHKGLKLFQCCLTEACHGQYDTAQLPAQFREPVFRMRRNDRIDSLLD